MGFFSDKVSLEIPESLSERLTTTAQTVGMGSEEFATAAIERLIQEHSIKGEVTLSKAQPVDTDEEGSIPVLLRLSPLQHQVIGAAATGYGASIEQVAKYGLFNFEVTLNPNKRSGQEMLDEIKRLQDPNEFFEARYDAQISALESTEEAEE